MRLQLQPPLSPLMELPCADHGHPGLRIVAPADGYFLPLSPLLEGLFHAVGDRESDYVPPLLADSIHSGTAAGLYQLLQRLSYLFHRLGALRD